MTIWTYLTYASDSETKTRTCGYKHCSISANAKSTTAKITSCRYWPTLRNKTYSSPWWSSRFCHRTARLQLTRSKWVLFNSEVGLRSWVLWMFNMKTFNFSFLIWFNQQSNNSLNVKSNKIGHLQSIFFNGNTFLPILCFLIICF